MDSRKMLALVPIAAFMGSASGGYLLLAPKTGEGGRVHGSCAGSRDNGESTTQLDAHGFGAVTLYQLPDPGRLLNAITVAPDGSLWFGTIIEPPTIGRVDANGQLHLYRITSDPGDVPAQIAHRP